MKAIGFCTIKHVVKNDRQVVNVIGTIERIRQVANGLNAYDIGHSMVEVGKEAELVYDGKPRNVKVEAIGHDYIKCFDLDKQQHRTFSFAKIG